MAIDILLYRNDNVSSLVITTMQLTLLNERPYYLFDHLNQNLELHLDNPDSHPSPNNPPLENKVFLFPFYILSYPNRNPGFLPVLKTIHRLPSNIPPLRPP